MVFYERKIKLLFSVKPSIHIDQLNMIKDNTVVRKKTTTIENK